VKGEIAALKPFLHGDWKTLGIPLAILAATLLVGFVVRQLLFRALRRRAERTGSLAAGFLLRSLRGTVMIWVLILALHLATEFSDLPARQEKTIGKTLLVLWIISLTLAAAQAAGQLVRLYGSRVQTASPVTSLTQNLVRLGVVTLGLLILLDVFGISITPLLTALGVTGLAVALGLQDTLSNLFAGFYISVANQVRIRDYIRLDSGEEGYVTDITWRSTTVQTLARNLIIVPNSKLAQAIVTNYHLPEKDMRLAVPVGVSYDSDPEAIERILVEVATAAAGEVQGLLAQPEPYVRFLPGFGDSSLNFTLYCQVTEFADQYLVQHELRKRIFKRFREEGIEIPFPIRTVYLRGKGGESSPSQLGG
jgi:small-conductance mechanosensitive channel